MILLFISIFSTYSSAQQTPLNGNSIGTPFDVSQCPCLTSSNQSACLPYDSRFQAFSLDEAMRFFPDLTMARNETDVDEPLSETCSTPQCKQCQEDIHRKLEQIGVVATTTVGLIGTPFSGNNITDSTATNTTICPKYRFSRNEVGVRNYGEQEVYEIDDDDDDSSDDDDEEEEEEKRKKEQKKREKKRRNKQKQNDRYRRGAISSGTTMTNPNVVGSRYPLSCTTKGVSADSSGFISLCSSCWVWRKLPDNYSPQFINELVCDDADNSCLSGYASCGVGHRTIEVIRDDNGVKTTVSMTAGTYCECRVAQNSALSSLVTGSGVSSALPAVSTVAGASTTLPNGRKK